MRKWVKWALVGGGALLLLKAVKGGSLIPGVKDGDRSKNGDAPGVETGDVTYTRYREAWEEARGRNRDTFNLKGVIVRQDSQGAFVWRYFWNTPTGAFDHKVHGGR